MSDNTPSRYVSMRAAAKLLGVPYPTFRKCFLAGFYPFGWYRVSQYRMKFLRSDIEDYAASMMPEKVVNLPQGESLEAVRVER